MISAALSTQIYHCTMDLVRYSPRTLAIAQVPTPFIGFDPRRWPRSGLLKLTCFVSRPFRLLGREAQQNVTLVYQNSREENAHTYDTHSTAQRSGDAACNIPLPNRCLNRKAISPKVRLFPPDKRIWKNPRAGLFADTLKTNKHSLSFQP